MPSLFIDGSWTAAAAGRQRDVVNPFDQSVVAKVDEAGAEDATRAVTAARGAFDRGDWPRSPATERAALLSRVAELLRRDREQIAVAETLDTGKTLRESRIDVDDVAAVFRYYAGLADKSAGRVIATGPGVLSRVVYEPVGVCVLIAPWNYPLLQMSWKVAPALAAGNTVILKPSEVTPTTTVRLVELLEEAGAPAGAEVGGPLVESPDVDLVSFTGGLDTGRSIARTAARTVKKVSLELGGKNPNIVFADADLEAAIDYAVTGAFLHSGQVCSAGARLLLAEPIAEEVVAEVARRAEHIRLGDGMAETTECGPLVSAEHRAKVEGYVDLGRREGARVAAGGHRPEDPDLRAGFFYRPTVFDGCDRSMRIVREEVFGPVLTVERFATEDEAVFLGNDTTYGLAGAVWTRDAGRAERVASRLRHGTIWINDFGPYLPQAEWGGMKQSGTGRELGLAGLEEYREAKHIYTNTAPRPQRWFAC